MGRQDYETETLIATALTASRSSTQCPNEDTTLVPCIGFDTYNQTVTGDQCQTLCSRGDSPGGSAHLVPAIRTSSAVRRLTPVECARLQGFPDDWLDITYRGRPASDGPKYKALGNSMAVPCMSWIGQRIAAVDKITTEERLSA